MKYKIKNRIIDAKSPVEALKIHKLLDSKCKDVYNIVVGAIFKSGKTFHGNHEYIRIRKIDENNVLYDTIVKEGNQYSRVATQEKSIDRLKEFMSRGEFRPVNSLYDSVKDSYYIVACEKGDYWFDETGKPNSFNKAKKFNSYEEADRWRRSKGEGSVQKITDEMKDSDDIEYLTEEEYQAVEDYRKAIANTTDPKLLRVFAHILKEETEHIEELENEDVEDSCKTKDYQPPYAIWVKESGKWKIWGGTHSTNVDKNAFKAKGYEDVVVVKNGEEPR